MLPLIMKKAFHNLAVYAAIVGSALFALTLILKYGPGTEFAPNGVAMPTHPTFLHDVVRNLEQPITLLFFQLLVVLIFSRLCILLFRKVGQTQVIGEIFAGLILGKSLFGYFWPAGFHYVFPETSMPRLYLLSQIGLVFFMFVVGLELNLKTLRKHATAAVLVSHGSIVVPFVLGAALSMLLYKDYAPKGVAFTSFSLFMGIAMSITAFPVLARILKDRDLTHTPLGTMALTCAAVDDVTAWCILAAVIGIVKAGSLRSAGGVLALSSTYMLLMMKAVRPCVARFMRPKADGTYRREQFALVFLVVLGSAFVTETIGIHALFGAFVAGTIMPTSLSFRKNVIQRVGDLTSVTLLPLFFTFTGIRTQMGLLNEASAWGVCALIILTAIVGKMCGSAGAARFSGLSWRESISIGALMNTRGLMELVVLNIGFDLGILSPVVFSMMVVMALVTTVMTAPLLAIFFPKESKVSNVMLVSEGSE